MIDGGLDYVHYACKGEPNTITHFYMFIEDHPFYIIRQYYYRWNHYKKEYVLLKDMDDDWLEAVLQYYIPSDKQVGDMKDEYLLLFLMEKQYRYEDE